MDLPALPSPAALGAVMLPAQFSLSQQGGRPLVGAILGFRGGAHGRDAGWVAVMVGVRRDAASGGRNKEPCSAGGGLRLRGTLNVVGYCSGGKRP